MSQRKPITIWSIMALIVLVGVGGLTVFASWYSVRMWVQGGQRFVIEQNGRVSDQVFLTEGDHIVFYESFVSLPTDYLLSVSASATPRVPAKRTMLFNDDPFVQQNKFEHGGVQGKPICRITAPADGMYDFAFYSSYTDMDPNDCVVFGKAPATLEEALQRKTLINIGGLSITGFLFIGLYFMHAITLSKRNKAAEPTTTPMGAGVMP